MLGLPEVTQICSNQVASVQQHLLKLEADFGQLTRPCKVRGHVAPQSSFEGVLCSSHLASNLSVRTGGGMSFHANTSPHPTHTGQGANDSQSLSWLISPQPIAFIHYSSLGNSVQELKMPKEEPLERCKQTSILPEDELPTFSL